MNDPELILLKRRQVDLLKKKVAAIKNFGLPFYRPWGKQEQFHRAGTKYKKRLFRAGNRSGKSVAGAAEDVAWLVGARTWLPQSDPAHKGGLREPPVKGLVITTDWDIVDTVWTSDRNASPGKLWGFLPKNQVKYAKRNSSGVIADIGLENGSVLRFDTVKSWLANPQGSESADWDFIHVDEPCPKAMFVANARGLMDRDGAFWFTLTPLSEWWINDLFFPGDETTWSVTASSNENPYLPKEALESFLSLLSEDEVQCRLHGLPLHLAGLVYKEFDAQRHLLKWEKLSGLGWTSPTRPPKSWPVYFYIDPHPRTPTCILFLTVDPQDRMYVFYDFFKAATIKELCEEFLSFVEGMRVLRGRIDPYAYINDPITGSNMAEDFAKHGVFVEKAVKDLDRGILAVKQAFREDRLFIGEAARRTLWEIQRYCWDSSADHLNKPVDKDDHAMECLYRAVLDFPRWIEEDGGRYNFPVAEEAFTSPQLEWYDFSYVSTSSS